MKMAVSTRRINMSSALCWLMVIVVGIVLIVALVRKGDVEANFKILGAGFSLKANDKN
jgi:hypothetical protein